MLLAHVKMKQIISLPSLTLSNGSRSWVGRYYGQSSKQGARDTGTPFTSESARLTAWSWSQWVDEIQFWEFFEILGWWTMINLQSGYVSVQNRPHWNTPLGHLVYLLFWFPGCQGCVKKELRAETEEGIYEREREHAFEVMWYLNSPLFLDSLCIKQDFIILVLP